MAEPNRGVAVAALDRLIPIAGPLLLKIAVISLPLGVVDPLLSGGVALGTLLISAVLVGSRHVAGRRGLLIAAVIISAFVLVVSILGALLMVRGYESFVSAG